MKTGRPAKYKTAEDMQSKIDKYFVDGCNTSTCLVNGNEITRRVPTITGLALYLGFVDRYSLYEYEKKREFTCTIKGARARIVQHYEELAQGNNVAGPIFMLKNFGYSDKQEIDLNAKVTKMEKIMKDGKPLEFNVGKKLEESEESEE